MCGRFYVKLLRYLEEYDQLQQSDWPQDFSSYNIAPTQNVPVVRMVDGLRTGAMLRWGLVPFWARGEPPKYSTINATIEKIESAATWRGPWQRGQRCILMASGFYEWHLNADGSKQPFAIEIADQPLFGFAGLWDRSQNDAGNVIESATIITMPANPVMAEIHNARQRMPAILRKEDHAAWLNGAAADAKAVLRQYPDDLMHAWKVSLRVNSPKNNDAQLIEPIPLR
jgi:putative SOS response-associated peptidase YedK